MSGSKTKAAARRKGICAKGSSLPSPGDALLFASLLLSLGFLFLRLLTCLLSLFLVLAVLVQFPAMPKPSATSARQSFGFLLILLLAAFADRGLSFGPLRTALMVVGIALLFAWQSPRVLPLTIGRGGEEQKQ